MKEQPWKQYIEPGRIFGNLYFVGSHDGSSHLIDTGDGLILIDSGYPQNLYQLINNIYELGFKPKDIKYILHSHGHYDHLGATKALAELTGAKTIIGKADERYADGTLDLTWAKELGSVYSESFTPDILLEDGDIVRLGNTEILCISTPGHTPGTMSFFFDVTDGKNAYRAAMHGGVGTNSMEKKFLDEYGLSLDCREDFIKGCERVENERVDIFIGNHVWNNNTEEKLKILKETGENPFINPDEWKEFIIKCKNKVIKMMKEDI